jgi:hypothetical protein
MLTIPTPGSCEIFCESVVSARSSILLSGKLADVSATVMIGESAGLILL